MASPQLRWFKLGSGLSRMIPLSVAAPIVEKLAALAGPRLMGSKAEQLSRHISRVCPQLEPSEVDELVKGGFGSYGRFWVELFKLPNVSGPTVGRHFSVEGYHHVQAALDRGVGPILALPHLGGWEWAAAWLGRVVGVQVTAVVEKVEPADLFEWFAEVRADNGIDVVPLGPEAVGRLAKAVKDRNIVCLLSDRDITGTGVEVPFFGETTTLPVGPAVLARRTGAPILPTAVYFDGSNHHGKVMAPIVAAPGVPLRQDVVRITTELAAALEELISAAPHQWHLLSPNWPSDYE